MQLFSDNHFLGINCLTGDEGVEVHYSVGEWLVHWLCALLMNKKQPKKAKGKIHSFLLFIFFLLLFNFFLNLG